MFKDLTGLVISTLPKGKVTEFFPGMLIVSLKDLLEAGKLKLL